MIDLTKITGFDWDDGNARKSEEKHEVSMAEAEQVFFNDPLLLLADSKHSQRENRHHALGKTDEGRLDTYHVHLAKSRGKDTRNFGQRHAQEGAQNL